MSDIQEAVGKIKRYLAVRNGKKKMVKKKEYSKDCPDGYKRGKDGKCVRMSQKEKMNRSKSAKKSQRKSSTKRKRSISMKRRSSQIK